MMDYLFLVAYAWAFYIGGCVVDAVKALVFWLTRRAK